MNKDEADMLITYYAGAPDEVAAMKREIGVNHPVVRYIEALELALKFAESDQTAMTEGEEERLQQLAAQQARKVRGEI